MENKFLRYIGKATNYKNKKVKKLSLKVKVSNVKGTFNITDIMLQESNTASGYTINTKEMLEKKTGKSKFYNILIRGKGNGVIVNNDGNATTGLDYIIYPATKTTGAIKVETLHKTVSFNVNQTIQAGKQMFVNSFDYNINNNGSINRDYQGDFLSIPAMFGTYNIDMANRDMANFIFKVQEYNKKDKY